MNNGGLTTQSGPRGKDLASSGILWDVLYAIDMGLVSLVAYWGAFFALERVSTPTSNTIGATWAVISALVVFREYQTESFSAAVSRLLATFVSAALCLIYLLFWPSTIVDMAIVITIGTVLMLLLQRHGEIATVAITTAVVMVIAIMEPKDAWHQPLLRLADSAIGIFIGAAAKWLFGLLFGRLHR